MANFGLGLAQGFQTGLNLSDRLKQQQREEELAKVFGMTPTDVGTPAMSSPEVASRQLRDAQAMGLGYEEAVAAQKAAPAQAEPAAQSWRLGETVFSAQPTAEGIQAARFREAARMMGSYSPIEAARLQQMANQTEFDARMRPLQEEAARLGVEASRLGTQETGLRIANLKQTEERNKKLSDVNSKVATWQKDTYGEKELGPEEFMAAMQRRTRELTRAGLHDEAGQAMQNYLSMATHQIQLQGAERGEALIKANEALARGDLGAVKDFYNKYVPNGAQVDKITRDRDGGFTIQQKSIDGTPLPPQKIKDIQQMAAVLSSFNDPKALAAWTQQSFTNNIALAHLSQGDFNKKIQSLEKGLGRKLTESELLTAGGIVPRERPPASFADISRAARDMIELNERDPDDPTKPLTLDKAITIAQARAAGVPYVSAVDRILASYDKNQGLKRAPDVVGAVRKQQASEVPSGLKATSRPSNIVIAEKIAAGIPLTIREQDMARLYGILR